MKLQNVNDRAKLQAAEEAQFVSSCQDEFVEKSLALTNARKVKTLLLISYMPNAISAVTAGFFVAFLLSSYPRLIAVLLGIVLLMVIISVEAGKRGLIAGLAKEFFVFNRLHGLAALALISLMAVSMGASYMGGKQLITETGSPPPREENPEIADLTAQLNAQRETIDRLQKTTWKGKITVDASKGIVQAKKIEASMVDRISTLRSSDDEAYTAIVDKSTGQRMNFGYLLGIIAAMADLFLLGLIWAAKRYKYEVAAMLSASQEHPAATAPHPGVHYMTGGAAALAASAPPPSDNQAQPRRQIGFSSQPETDDTDAHEMRNAMRNAPQKGATEKECPECNTTFTARTTWHKYCSEECKIAAWEKRTGKIFHKK